MIPSIPIAFAALASLALAENRVFRGLGDSACQACLAKVEAACKGPISSDQFNDCFCDADGDAWANLEDCLTVETDCDKTKESILGYYGAHCFAWKDDEEEEFCVDASQDNELKMSIADSFCDEFITLSSSVKSTTATEESSSKQTTESEAAESETVQAETTTSEQRSISTPTSEAEAQQSTSQDVATTTRTAGGSTATKSNNGSNNDEDDDDDDDSNDDGNDDSSNDDGNDDNSNGGSNLSSMSVSGLAMLALWTGYMLSS
ncbi:hypothetical protein G7Z17_g9044 [Cylindrodendrum hubeiense]|uniref:Extracellular membrane protein CFEM domain-containing protein n=1 Tax=Cylindrodendrum hubeiense TaxID=595255 RepID=A0A9P5H4Q6_9HYPO|nr:hypothetical protein G7Z17_g9044 [Cylindrodendrum hubeiense]